jgi:hypothetical protein
MAKPIKLTGREAAIVRAIGFGLGVPGEELRERLQMAADDVVDVLNAMLEAGFIESASMKERVSIEDFGAEEFEVNPSYAADLKTAIRRY